MTDLGTTFGPYVGHEVELSPVFNKDVQSRRPDPILCIDCLLYLAFSQSLSNSKVLGISSRTSDLKLTHAGPDVAQQRLMSLLK